MPTARNVEVFTAGCPVCDDTVQLVQRLACDACEVDVLDMNDEAVARRAADLGIRSVPAVVVDGTLTGRCTGGGVTEEALRAEGVGQPV